MATIKTRNARSAIVRLLAETRRRIAEARDKAKGARESSLYTHEGKQEISVGWAKEARKSTRSALEKARAKAEEVRKAAEGQLAKSLTVSDAERTKAALILSYGIRLKPSMRGEQRPSPPPATPHSAEENNRIRYHPLSTRQPPTP